MLKRFIVKGIDWIYRRHGFYKGYGISWVRTSINEYKNSELPIRDRVWALKRGFYPYRIAQYNLTDDNYKTILSDRDYKKLFPINNKYRKYIDDKLVMKYILSPFDEYLPEYYYHLISGRGCEALKLQDCPASYNANYTDVLKLLREKGELAVKPTGGTYGIGFSKMCYVDGEYCINNKIKTETEMYSFLKSLEDHIVIEYVKMHEVIKSLNSNSLNTIRVMVINEDGCNPVIPSAFMRIGTKQSGVVDNTAQGGMFCKVDVETGRFYDGEKINNHIITPAPVHPDTGIEIEGILPHWQLIKEKLIEIANYIPQIEWMGFDIAITPDGFNIIEINSHQGLHRYHTYPEYVKLYFERKKEQKKIK